MIQKIVWRRNVGWVAGLVVFPLVWYLLGDYVRDGGQMYRTDLTSRATNVTFIPLTVVAVLSAWEGVRVTVAVRDIPGIRRSALTMAMLASGPAIMASCAAYALAVGARLLAAGMQPPLPTVPVSLGVIALHLAVALGGVAVGSVSSTYLAAPLAGAGIYGMFIILSTASNGILRLLFGQQYECCALYQSPSNTAIAVPLVTSIGLGSLSTAVLAWRWRRQISLPSITAVVATALLVWAVWATLAAGRSGTVSARGGDLICETSATSGVEYCVWPQHNHLLQQLMATGDRAFDSWNTSIRLGTPDLVTEQMVDSAPTEVVSISIGPEPAGEDVIAALARGMIPKPPDCVTGWQNGAAYTQLMAWLLRSAGVSADHLYLQELQAMTPFSEGDPVVVAQRLEDASAVERQAWLDAALAAFNTCDASFDSTSMQP